VKLPIVWPNGTLLIILNGILNHLDGVNRVLRRPNLSAYLVDTGQKHMKGQGEYVNTQTVNVPFWEKDQTRKMMKDYNFSCTLVIS
jgi:hypothetical protein